MVGLGTGKNWGGKKRDVLALKLLKEGKLDEAERALRTEMLLLRANKVARAKDDLTQLQSTTISRHLGLMPGDQVEAEYIDGAVILRPMPKGEGE